MRVEAHSFGGRGLTCLAACTYVAYNLSLITPGFPYRSKRASPPSPTPSSPSPGTRVRIEPGANVRSPSPPLPRPRPPPPPGAAPSVLAAAREQFPSIPPSPLHRMSILGHLRQQVSTAVRCSLGGIHPCGPLSRQLHATLGTTGRQADKIKKLDRAGSWGRCEGGGGGKWGP